MKRYPKRVTRAAAVRLNLFSYCPSLDNGGPASVRFRERGDLMAAEWVRAALRAAGVSPTEVRVSYGAGATAAGREGCVAADFASRGDAVRVHKIFQQLVSTDPQLFLRAVYFNLITPQGAAHTRVCVDIAEAVSLAQGAA